MLWLQVTNDEYQLPLAVASSSRELSRITGISDSTIRYDAINREKGRKVIKGREYFFLRIEEDSK